MVLAFGMGSIAHWALPSPQLVFSHSLAKTSCRAGGVSGVDAMFNLSAIAWPNHAVNTDAHRRRFAPWWSPVTLIR